VTSDEHFTADGTLIESWASRKSFARKDGGDGSKRQEAKQDDPGNPTVDYGEKSNATRRTKARPIRRACSTARRAARKPSSVLAGMC
jgi:hypothetical protein